MISAILKEADSLLFSGADLTIVDTHNFDLLTGDPSQK
jgi:hypothetical protein